MPESNKFTVFFFGWMGLITYLSLASFSGYDEFDMEVPYLDKAVHFVFYFVATFLGCFFVRERTHGNFPIGKTMVLTGIFMFLYGTFIEILQYACTTERSGEITDFLANTIGILLSLVLVYYLFSIKTGLKWRQ